MGQLKAEQETILTYNRADRANGYFSFGTSQKSDFNRLCRRVGGQSNLIKVKVSRGTQGQPTWWEARVPIKYSSRVHFGVRKNAALPNAKGSDQSSQKVDSQYGKSGCIRPS